MRDLRERRYKPATVARKVAAAKSFLKFLVERGKLKDDPTRNLASPRVGKPVPKSLSVSEVRGLLQEPAKLSTVEARRDKVMLELLYATGLRASELMSLNLADIDVKAGSVYCSSRGSKNRTVPISRSIVQLVKEYMETTRFELLEREEETALFLNCRGERLTRQGFWLIIKGYASKIGLSSKVTPRTLRHSFAAHKLKSGTDLHSVQELLGHAHISSTRLYKQDETRL